MHHQQTAFGGEGKGGNGLKLLVVILWIDLHNILYIQKSHIKA